MTRPHHDLKVWQLAMDLPRLECFGVLGGLIESQRDQTDPSQAATLPGDKPRSGRLAVA